MIGSYGRTKASLLLVTSMLLSSILFAYATPTNVNTEVETGTQQERWEKFHRVPKETLPLHYDVYLHPDLDTGLFSGRVTIHLAVSEPMNFLVVHIKNINISTTELRSLETNATVPLADTFHYEPNQFWVLRCSSEIPKGNYSVHMVFTGSMENKLKGFYKSVYTNAAGQKRSIATSQFQPADARQAFPCLDEPSFKSTFNVTLVRPSQEYIALSNMPVEKEIAEQPSAGLTEVVFQKSVPMVTYLAIFVVCDFGFIETTTQSGKPFRVYAAKDKVSTGQYGLDIGVSILNYFENYFEIEFPLPKLDQIAIPDFGAGAMEHWGLVTYREVYLLNDEAESSSYNKQYVASIVSHELAHMWFGNLMTLKWWDDLWLNEGFASYVEYKGVDQYEKDWDMLEQFVHDVQGVFKLDSKLSSHPIVQTVEHPDEIAELFDSITYSKGSSVLRMLDNFMGEEPFRVGVRNFLREFAFKNAVTADLWRHLQLTSNGNYSVSDVMDTWTKQMGYPVLNIKKTDGNQVTVEQQRFLQNPKAVSRSDSPYNYKWDIPVTYRTDATPRELTWLNRSQDQVTIALPTNSTWVKFNVDQYGYYRVNYDISMWQQLAQVLKENHEVLSAPDRSSLIDDAFSLAAAEQLPYTVALDLASYLEKETHFIPWRSAVRHFFRLDDLLMTTKAYPLYREYLLKVLHPHIQRLGWEDTGSHLERRLRPLLIGLASHIGSTACLEGAKQRLQQWLQTNSTTRTAEQSIPPNLRSVVYSYGVKSLGYEEWQAMLQRYSEETNAQEKVKLLNSLTSTEVPWIMYRYLDLSKNTTLVRSHDYLTGLARAASSPTTRLLVWDYVKANYDYLVDRFTIGSRKLGSVLKTIVGRFNTRTQLEDAERFFLANPKAGAGARSREQGIEEANTNIVWIEMNADTLYEWFMNKTSTI